MSSASTTEQGGHGILSTAEDRERTNVHYEQPPAFFNLITGGEWNVYSCNIWSNATTDTESQEAKLDLLARLMGLKPGQRILDVGCGWAGPLVYLSKKYGVQGVGLTLSPTQKEYADRRIAEHGADVEVIERHWQEYEDERGFDAIYTDEVIVHFADLGGFFAKAHSLLRPGGRFVNKELHFVNSRYKQLTPTGAFVDEIYGLTGNYRTLGEELTLLDQHGFALRAVQQIPLENYKRTAGRWLANMQEHREALQRAVGVEHYRRFRTYLRLVQRIMSGRTMSMDVIVATKLAA
jgi:cyclopropane-fatty-acyl-phospholipid synthase